MTILKSLYFLHLAFHSPARHRRVFQFPLSEWRDLWGPAQRIRLSLRFGIFRDPLWNRWVRLSSFNVVNFVPLSTNNYTYSYFQALKVVRKKRCTTRMIPREHYIVANHHFKIIDFLHLAFHFHARHRRVFQFPLSEWRDLWGPAERIRLSLRFRIFRRPLWDRWVRLSSFNVVNFVPLSINNYTYSFKH